MEKGEAKVSYVDTPRGLFTASGVWFQATEAALEQYAGAVLQREPLARLVPQAEVWLRAPQTVALWVLAALLPLVSIPSAAAATLGAYVLFALFGPGLVNRPLGAVLAVLDRVILQAVFYFIVLSMLATGGSVPAMWAGLAGFVLLRWGLVERLLAPLLRPLQARLYALPIPDQVLRACIVRAAIHHGADLPEVDRMAQRLADIMTRHKRS